MTPEERSFLSKAGDDLVQIATLAAAPLLLYDNTKPLAARIQSYSSKINKLGIAISWVETLPPMFNNAFIIWRAWVVFQKRRWALYLSIFVCIIATVIWLHTKLPQ
ncbi:hypothetical protein DXG01_008125 [Tephrocybe rancida]|nr:hypothetical protein DXG01_008125 [Tephrocybe rancida]